MKKTILLFAAVMMAAVTFAQAQPTVSASSVTFKYCKTTEGSERKTIASTDFPFTWHDVVCPTPGTYVTTLVNARGCDSIVTLIAEEFHPFSVAANKKVQIAKGNLKYLASEDKWSFHEHGYEYIGEVTANTNPQETQSDWMDMFAFGSASKGTRCAANDNNDSHYTWLDWGSNPIDDYPANYWYTMTKGEWQYLCQSRANNSRLINYNCKVGNTNGWIILPDDWDLTNFTWASPYTEEDWNELENKGAVFIPFAGSVDSRSYTQKNQQGFVQLNNDNSYLWVITNGFFTNSFNKKAQYSVRLAHYPQN